MTAGELIVKLSEQDKNAFVIASDDGIEYELDSVSPGIVSSESNVRHFGVPQGTAYVFLGY